LVELCQRLLRRLKSLGGSPADVGVAEDGILRNSVAVDQRSAIDEQRARFALFRRLLEPFQTLCLIAVLKQEQPERGLRIDMPFRGSALEPILCFGEIGRHAAPEAVGLTEI